MATLCCLANLVKKDILAKYRDIEFLLQVGEFQKGTDADADAAVAIQPNLLRWMKQSINERVSAADSFAALKTLLA